jgi:tetratricopeptide (TPR) repeat protein
LAAGLLLCGWATSASAQQQVQIPKVEDLIGNSVSDASAANYPEVQSAIKRFFVERDVNGARADLEVARSKHQTLPPAEIMMAQFLALAQQVPMARAELELGVKKELEGNKPVDPEFYLIFGDVAFQERRFTDAELLFAKAEALISDYSLNAIRKRNLNRRALAGEAAVAEAREDWATAQKDLVAWLQIDADSAPAHQRLGRTLFKLNKPAEAEAEFQKAAEADKKVLPAEIMMGRLYEEAEAHTTAAKQMAKAIENLKKLPASDKQLYVNICLAVAQWAVQTGDLKTAKVEADKALQRDSSSLETQIVSGLIARLNNDWSTAEADFEKAHDLSPSNFIASNNLALVLAENGAKAKDDSKLKRAKALAEVNARQYQQNAEAIATLGWVYYKMGKKDEAKQAIFAVANSGSVSADSAYYVAQVLSDMGEATKAQLVLAQALNNKQPFAMRSAAETLKKEVDKKVADEKAANDKK